MRTADGARFCNEIREHFWPISRKDTPKVLCFMALIFWVALTYNYLKISKDAIVLPRLGGSAVPFIKVWFIVPGALAMTAFYSQLTRRFSNPTVFNIMVMVFSLYFLIFSLAYLPRIDALTLDGAAELALGVLPSGWGGLAEAIRYLPLTCFYVVSELWSTTIWFVLFWGYVNRASSLSQAKSFYPLLALVGNSTGLVAPYLFMRASRLGHSIALTLGGRPESFAAVTICLTAAVMCLGVALIYSLVHLSVVPDVDADAATQPGLATAHASPGSFWGSFAVLLQNQHARAIAGIVLGYNLVVNLSEILWKQALVVVFPTQEAYGAHFGSVMFWTSVLAVAVDLGFCSKIIRRWGWYVAASITPWTALLTSLGFFGFVSFGHYGMAAGTGWDVLYAGVLVGSVQNMLLRACKYSFFDTTKEMAYFPLSAEAAKLAKAAIDGVGSRLGKLGGAALCQVLMALVPGSMMGIAPFLGIAVMLLTWCWVAGICSLRPRMEAFQSLAGPPAVRNTARVSATPQASGAR